MRRDVLLAILTEGPTVITPICFFNYQAISPTGLEVLCTSLEADKGPATGQDRSWQGLNFPPETG